MNAKTTPKDFFLHLGALIALYSSAIALANLAFTVVDRAFPDALSIYWSASSVVWPISMLIVLIPALYILEWAIARDISKIPEKRLIWVRRWRIYLTLFLAGATIVGDLITLINTYLNGEVTSQFIWKVLAVLIVCVVLFAYYILERMSDSKNVKKPQSILAWIGIIIVLGAIVSGFLIVGSPATQRSIRFDEQRISDLNTIQDQVIEYWQQKGALPAALSDLNDPLTNFSVPVDPETGQSYEYSVSNAGTSVNAGGGPAFDLCATFDRSSVSDQSADMPSYAGPNGIYDPALDSWYHVAGHACFDRSIDPSRYPPAIKNPAV